MHAINSFTPSPYSPYLLYLDMPIRLAIRHIKLVCSSKIAPTLIEKLSHIAWAIFEAIPVVGLIVSGIDEDLSTRKRNMLLASAPLHLSELKVSKLKELKKRPDDPNWLDLVIQKITKVAGSKLQDLKNAVTSFPGVFLPSHLLFMLFRSTYKHLVSHSSLQISYVETQRRQKLLDKAIDHLKNNELEPFLDCVFTVKNTLFIINKLSHFFDKFLNPTLKYHQTAAAANVKIDTKDGACAGLTYNWCLLVLDTPEDPRSAIQRSYFDASGTMILSQADLDAQNCFQNGCRTTAAQKRLEQ